MHEVLAYSLKLIAYNFLMTKNEIADMLTEIGTLLELKGENPFKTRAYQTGARALEAIEEADLARLIADGKTRNDQRVRRGARAENHGAAQTGKLGVFRKTEGVGRARAR